MIISFFIGGFLGFNQGYSHGMVGSANDANIAVAVLKRLEENRKEDAICLLNTLIDSKILTYDNAKFSDDFLIPFSPILFMLEKEVLEDTMTHVLIYRRENPSANGNLTSYVDRTVE